jgi:hypothetical protein
MKIALITTTINVPSVLALYRRFDPSASVRFFVAGDQKTDHSKTQAFCDSIGECIYLPPSRQTYKCSDLIGWGCVQRRNIALLEAVKWGADIIITIDTDNYPVAPNFFHAIEERLTHSFTGLSLEGVNGWVDPGWLIEPAIAHRGMPKRLDRIFCRPAIARDVGVVACTVIGSCDLSAVDRVAADRANQPRRYTGSSLAAGVVVYPDKSWTVFNTQAVAFRRELAPAIAAWSGVGRFDDICGSLLAQRIMREKGFCTYMGAPIVWHEHERSDAELTRNIKGEVWGYENIERLAIFLNGLDLQGDGSTAVTSMVRRVHEQLREEEWCPKLVPEWGLAFLQDMEDVL